MMKRKSHVKWENSYVWIYANVDKFKTRMGEKKKKRKEKKKKKT